jgi:hypothetical protein
LTYDSFSKTKSDNNEEDKDNNTDPPKNEWKKVWEGIGHRRGEFEYENPGQVKLARRKNVFENYAVRKQKGDEQVDDSNGNNTSDEKKSSMNGESEIVLDPVLVDFLNKAHERNMRIWKENKTA